MQIDILKRFAGHVGMAFLLTMSLSCSTRSEGSGNDTMNSEEEFVSWEESFPGLTWGEMKQLIITSIAEGDKKTFAGLVEYPIRRDYPLRDIENKEQMIEKFDLIFDAKFRDTLRTMDSNSWEAVGWRGYMLCDGMLWGDGLVEIINYSSPHEQQLRQKIIKAEIAALHPSLRGPWEPIDRFLLDDSNYEFARIDMDTTPDGLGYRLTLFKKNADVGDKPAMTLYGSLTMQGSICYETYEFGNNDVYGATYEPDYYPEGEENIESFRPFILLTKPNGKETRLTIAKNHYYQPCKITMK